MIYIYTLILGMYREAEAQYKSSLKLQPIINTYLDLCNVYIRLDVPNTAINLLKEARYYYYYPYMQVTLLTSISTHPTLLRYATNVYHACIKS